MSDFAQAVQKFTCLSDASKQKVIESCANLPTLKKDNILSILQVGEDRKQTLQEEYDGKMLALLEDYLGKVKNFKRGPLREATRKAEEADHGRDEDAAEDLLKQL